MPLDLYERALWYFPQKAQKLTRSTMLGVSWSFDDKKLWLFYKLVHSPNSRCPVKFLPIFLQKYTNATKKNSADTVK